MGETLLGALSNTDRPYIVKPVCVVELLDKYVDLLGVEIVTAARD